MFNHNDPDQEKDQENDKEQHKNVKVVFRIIH